MPDVPLILHHYDFSNYAEKARLALGYKGFAWRGVTIPPEYIVETLLDIQHRWPGLTEVNIGHPVGTPKQVVLDNLERFAAEVMPAFQRRSSQTPVAAG